MAKKQQNYEKFEYLEKMNENKLENAVERLGNVLGQEIDFDEVVDVCDASYKKDDKEVQLNEILTYFEIDNSNPKAMFWARKVVKFNGLKTWATIEKNKCMRNEAE